jgi:carbon monoxide dehydrogenase subunit G
MAMEMDHSFTVPVPPDRAWDVLLDVERIAPCMPGASVDEFDGEVVTGRIKVKVGPVSLTYRGTAKFTERDPDARVIVLEASGKETRGAGTASATVRARLEPESGGEATKATMHTTMNVTGRPAQFGRGVMVEVGGKLVEQFAQNLRQLITDDSQGGGGAEAGTTEAGTTEARTTEAGATEAGAATDGATEAGAATDGGASADQATTATQDGPGSTQPSPVISSAAPSAATTTAPPAQASADSINLVKLVGPALLKRVVPVAVVAAVLALLGRRLFRRGGKD